MNVPEQKMGNVEVTANDRVLGPFGAEPGYALLDPLVCDRARSLID